MLKEMLFSNAIIGVSGSDVDVEELTVTENGEYYDGDNVAYSPVYVNVPQTTVTALTATENKTYTAPAGTAYSPVTVNVSGSGTSYSTLASKEYAVKSTTQAVTNVGVINVDETYVEHKLIYVNIRDKSTVANGCFFGTDTWCYKAPNASAPSGSGFILYYRNDSGNIVSATPSSKSGVYVSFSSSGSSININVSAKFVNGTSGAIDSTYVVTVYSLDFPNDAYPA